MIDDIYEDREPVESGTEPGDYLEDQVLLADDDGHDVQPAALVADRSGVAWREIEKYRERKALEKFLQDDLYDELDIRNILD